MSDAQDKSLQEDPELESTAVSEEVVMDEVAEDRSASKKKSGFTGFLVTLVLLSGAAGAGWYYQSMWLPQVQDGAEQVQLKVQQAQVWLDDLLSFGKGRDRMAAPMPKGEPAETTVESSKPNYVVAAISDPKPVVEKELIEDSDAVEKEIPVVEPVVKIDDAPVIVEKVETPVVADVAVVEPVEEMPHVSVIKDAEQLAPDSMNAPAVAVTEMPMVKPPVEIKPATTIDLASARQAFWQRDLPKAEALYKEQINNSQANADSWGELGNIYYFQAKWQQAAFAYTEAAILLLDKGDFPQAMFLRYIVSGLDPVQTRRIDDRLRALQAPLNG